MIPESSAPSAAPAAIPAPPRCLLTVKQLSQQQPALTEAGIRWDLFNRHANGLTKAGAIIRRGRRILIDPERYLEWMTRRGLEVVAVAPARRWR